MQQEKSRLHRGVWPRGVEGNVNSNATPSSHQRHPQTTLGLTQHAKHLGIRRRAQKGSGFHTESHIPPRGMLFTGSVVTVRHHGDASAIEQSCVYSFCMVQTWTQSRGLMQFGSDASCPDGYDHCSMATERCYGLTMGRVRR